MNIQKLLNNKIFLNTSQFYKREVLDKYILKEENCKIGKKVICFETEYILSEENKFFYKQSTIKKVKTLTIGKEYEIIDIRNNGNIKIKNDNGNKLWYTPNRFLYSLKLERKAKLEKINKLKLLI